MVGISFVFALRAFSFSEEDRPTLKLENDQAEVVVDLGGGSISEYRLKANSLNPLQWDSWSFNPRANEEPPMDPRSMGHSFALTGGDRLRKPRRLAASPTMEKPLKYGGRPCPSRGLEMENQSLE